MMNRPQRRVVCAANKYDCDYGGIDMIFIGVRHFCPIMRQNMEPHKDFIKVNLKCRGSLTNSVCLWTEKRRYKSRVRLDN